MIIVPRTRSIRLGVRSGSVHASVCRTDKTNKRRIGGATSTIHLARLPANVTITVRSRHSRVGGHRGTVGVLHAHMCSGVSSRTRSRCSTAHGSTIKANSHSRQVHACGFPRGHIASRQVNLALRGLSAVLDKGLSRIVSTLVVTSRARGLRSLGGKSVWQTRLPTDFTR